MAQFNEKEHLQNITALAEELAKILKNSMIIVHDKLKKIEDLSEMAKNLLAGKRTPLLEMNPGAESKQGKYLLDFQGQKPTLVFLEKQPILQIPASLKQLLTPEDTENMQKFGNVNRVIYVDVNGVATPKYVSLDRETNTLATMATHKLSIADKILGVDLTVEQKSNLKAGNSIILKGLNSKDNGEKWDAVVSVDALSKGLSFKKVDINIPKILLGVELSLEQREKIKNGEGVLVYDLTSKKTGNQFSAIINLNEGLLEINPIHDAPKKLLGLSLTHEQRSQLRMGESISLTGLTSKTGEFFDASVNLDALKGLNFKFNQGDKNVEKKSKITEHEEISSIPIIEESAYGGRMKKTPSIKINRENVVQESQTALKKSKNQSPVSSKKKSVPQ
jgi:Protein of unknown function (DUF3945)